MTFSSGAGNEEIKDGFLEEETTAKYPLFISPRRLLHRTCSVTLHVSPRHGSLCLSHPSALRDPPRAVTLQCKCLWNEEEEKEAEAKGHLCP